VNSHFRQGKKHDHSFATPSRAPSENTAIETKQAAKQKIMREFKKPAAVLAKTSPEKA
jgi:hypothetical protein